MANLSREALDRGAVAAFGPPHVLTVALLTGPVEESDPGYQRRPVSMHGPEDGPDGGRVMTNAEDVMFAPYVRASLRRVDGWALFEGDQELIRGALEEPRSLSAGDQFVIRAGMIRAGFRSD